MIKCSADATELQLRELRTQRGGRLFQKLNFKEDEEEEEEEEEEEILE